jgi:histidinol dehydrogenase
LDCPIDFYAGPTEIVVLTMAGNPAWIAADLIAQAEHDPDARSIVVTPNRSLAREITDHVKKQLPARGPALSSMRRFGTIVIVKSIDEAVGLVNKIAPEHLVCDRSDIARRTTRAGTILIGPYGAQAAGDYATGSNHVLPTGGAAQFRGGLSASDFVHIHSVQRISRKGLSTLSPAIVSLAEAEGLTAHAESVKVRMARAKSGGRANRPIH